MQNKEKQQNKSQCSSEKCQCQNTKTKEGELTKKMAEANARAAMYISETEEKNKELENSAEEIRLQKEHLAEANARAAMLMLELEEKNQKLKDAHTEITQQKEYIEEIFKGMLDTLVVVDNDGKIVEVNKATLDLLGYTLEELKGKPLSVILSAREVPDNLAKIMEVLNCQKELRNLEIYYRHNSGKEIPMLLACSTLAKDKDKFKKFNFGVLCAATDITERKESEECLRTTMNDLQEKEQRLFELNVELKEKNKRLRHLDQLKSQFVSNVAHEFKNPLFVIRESTALVLEFSKEKLDERHIKLLENAKRNIDRLIRLVLDLLDLAKIESGKIKLNTKEFDVSNMLERIVSFYELSLQQKKLQLIQNTPKELPLIKGDEDKIEQAVINVLNNAIKFTPEGGVIELSVFQSKDFVEFVIKDSGKGIAKDEQNKIFDKFERVTKEKEEGSGLGLPIAKDIIELHKGIIGVESEPGKGSRFYIKLPKA